MKFQNDETIKGGIHSLGASDFVDISGFVGDSIVDGPGLRCTIFCQGCPHACKGCHNPNTHPFNIGTKTSIEALYKRIKSYPLCRAVTFSGGEPFCQSAPLAKLANILKKEKYELAAYSGYTFEELASGTKEQKTFLQTLDTLVDGRFVLEKRNLSLRFRGSENQRIIKVGESLKQGKAVLETNTRWVG